MFVKGTVEEEFAEACIRIFYFAGLKNIDLVNYDYEGIPTNDYSGKSFTEAVYNITRYLATKYYKVICSLPGYYRNGLCDILNEIFAFCDNLNINILWHIEQKMIYNEIKYKHEKYAVDVCGDIHIVGTPFGLAALIDSGIPHTVIGRVCTDRCDTSCLHYRVGTCPYQTMKDVDGRFIHVLVE